MFVLSDCNSVQCPCLNHVVFLPFREVGAADSVFREWDWGRGALGSGVLHSQVG